MLKKKMIRTGLFGYGCLMLVPNPAAVRNQDLVQQTYLLSASDTSPAFGEDSVLPIRPSTVSITQSPALKVNRAASRFASAYLQRESEALQKIRARSATYFRIIDNVFSKYELPTELRYLAVVESDLKTDARSRMGARGLWQLMPEISRDFGLKINGDVDERTHAYKSTVAAAKYIKCLYNEFHDWLLVLAAYNSGMGTVQRAIKRSGSRNFWALQHCLPAESRAHVKRYIGTLLFFEGKPGVTTVTNAEYAAHTKAVREFEEKGNW